MNAALAAFMSAVFPTACLWEILRREEQSQHPPIAKKSRQGGSCAPASRTALFWQWGGAGGESQKGNLDRAKRGPQPSTFPFHPVFGFFVFSSSCCRFFQPFHECGFFQFFRAHRIYIHVNDLRIVQQLVNVLGISRHVDVGDPLSDLPAVVVPGWGTVFDGCGLFPIAQLFYYIFKGQCFSASAGSPPEHCVCAHFAHCHVYLHSLGCFCQNLFQCFDYCHGLYHLSAFAAAPRNSAAPSQGLEGGEIAQQFTTRALTRAGCTHHRGAVTMRRRKGEDGQLPTACGQRRPPHTTGLDAA